MYPGKEVRMKKILMALALLVMPAAVWADVTIGEPAPNFTLKDTLGKEHSLSSFKGNFVVLEWVNTDCPFVKKHYDGGNMQTLQKKYTDQGIVWLAINSSAPGKQGHYAPAELNEIMKSKGSHATAVLLDSDGKVGQLYGAKTTPHMFVIDIDGKLIYQGAIDSIASADPADIAKSENYVTSALDAAKANKPVAMASTKSYGCSVKY